MKVLLLIIWKFAIFVMIYFLEKSKSKILCEHRDNEQECHWIKGQSCALVHVAYQYSQQIYHDVLFWHQTKVASTVWYNLNLGSLSSRRISWPVILFHLCSINNKQSSNSCTCDAIKLSKSIPSLIYACH